jgi:2,5-dioxopentanoate dehydrogenase
MSIITGQIIGNSTSVQGSTTFQAFNPAAQEVLAPVFYEATAAETDRAVTLAHNAWWQYRKTTTEQRATFLEAIAAEIVALGDVLLETANVETALPLARLIGERGRTTGQLQLFADFIRRPDWERVIVDEALPDRQPLPRPRLVQRQVPLGVVGVFGASNFPFAFSVAGGDTVSALAAGCPVVFKAHPAHPATCALVGAAIVRAANSSGMPEGVFSMIQGASNEVGARLVTHPLVKAVGFTGSYRGGKSLYDLAVRRPEPIPVYAEMGSTNPVFFLPGALKNAKMDIAEAFVNAITLGNGQFCTNPGVFVVSAQHEAFVGQVAEKLSAIAPGPMLTGGIGAAYQKGIEHQRGLTNVVPVTTWPGNANTPHLLKTTVKAALKIPELTEEVFGPSTVAIVADDMASTLDFARQLKGHLTATIWADASDMDERYQELVDILTTKAGRIILNGFPTGVEVCHAMVHGGPFPATTDVRSTSVGTQAIYRFMRPVVLQGFK